MAKDLLSCVVYGPIDLAVSGLLIFPEHFSYEIKIFLKYPFLSFLLCVPFTFSLRVYGHTLHLACFSLAIPTYKQKGAS